MKSDNLFPKGFDPSSSILFLGSGFSAEAKNIVGTNPPVGDGLRKKFLELLNLDESEESDLKDLADYAFKNGKNVLKLLRNQYTISQISNNQEEILQKQWRRIYTTNYDDLVEYYNQKNKVTPRPESFSNEDPIPRQVRAGTIIHIHGYIHRMTDQNVMRQAVLGHRSYAEQAATSSPWWQQFDRDIRSAEHIFFVGYSLADFETASYLTRSTALASKTHFILRENQSPIVQARLNGYGSLHEIAVVGFAAECRAAIDGKKPQHANMLTSLQYFDINKDNRIPVRPTPVEIENLFTYGTFNIQRLFSTFPKAEYIMPREALVDRGIEYLRTNKTLIIHSKIGNGKSTLRKFLSMKLTVGGYSCFVCRDDVTIPDRDIEFLRTQAKPVVIFTNFDTAYASMHLFRDLPSAARFIVEINTGTLQVRRNEVFEALSGPIERLDVNLLTSTDIEQLDNLLDRAGIAPNDLRTRFKSGSEIRDIVLALYGNDSIAKKIDQLVSPLLLNADFKNILFSSSILRALDVKTDPTFLRSVNRVDAYSTLSAIGEKAYEFFDFSHDRLEPHSALFSEYLVQSFLDPNELIDIVYWLCAEAAKRMYETVDLQSERHRDARQALGMLITHWRLVRFLKNHANRDALIEDLYEKARSNSHISSEPLFWLQYSIFMQDQQQWPVAEKHMETAYDRGADRPGFQTYQLDTNSLSLLMDLEISNKLNDNVERFEKIISLTEKIRTMLSDGNHRGHALRVVEKYEKFVNNVRHKLSNTESVSLTYHLNLIEMALDSFDLSIKAELGSNLAKNSIKRAVALLTR